MFTGIIEEVGTVLWIRAHERATQLHLTAPDIAGDVHTGESIAVNGCCLTVTKHLENRLTFDLLGETLERTNLKNLRPEAKVNLERALPANGRLGGHFVQGHIDCTAPIVSLKEEGADLRLEAALPTEFARYIVPKGSIAINGISLTVAEVLRQSFSVWIIPHTRRSTNVSTSRAGDVVNLEFDILAKYVERLTSLERVASPPGERIPAQTIPSGDQ